MIVRLLIAAVALAALWSVPCVAASTDLQPTAVNAYRASGGTCTGQGALQNQPICVSVKVKNLGPDAYQGSVGSELSISVDIDEPTKPGLDPVLAGCRASGLFGINIAAGDSAVVTMGPLTGACTPMTPGTHTARATATARGSNSDPVSGNNSITVAFSVASATPALRTWGLIAAALLMVAGAMWAVRKPRMRRAGD